MACGKDSIILREPPSFETVLDTACERLWEKRILYSLRRIREMDEELLRLEKELDEFIGQMPTDILPAGSKVYQTEDLRPAADVP